MHDLVYKRVGERSLRLELHLPQPKPQRPAPLVMWVHGGGWRNGDHRASCPSWLAERA